MQFALFRGSLLKVYISISSTMYGLFTKSIINEDSNIEQTNEASAQMADVVINATWQIMIKLLWGGGQ